MSVKESQESAANSSLTACERTEVAHIVDLGLGRGIDATNPRPWQNKTSFQVRRVVYEELIGTEEGGAVNEYTNQIRSSATLQKSMLLAITQSKAPVRVEVAGEKARSPKVALKSVGKRVVTRTISYRENCAPEIRLRSADPSTQAAQDSFEERLWKWICDKTEFQVLGPDVTVLDSFDQLVNKAENPAEQREKVIEACREFVNVFRATHYVTAIELGAAEYTVEYPPPESSDDAEQKNKRRKKKSKNQDNDPSETGDAGKLNKKKIGIINDDGTVTRRSHGEVVLAVKIQPVSRLIEQPFLKLALQLAMVQFIEEYVDKEGGPYFIGLNDGKIFLSVNDNDSTVGATTDVENAAPFYISQPDEDPGEPVVISYYKKAVTGEHTAKLKVHKIARYLQVATSKKNKDDDSLEVQYHIRSRSHSRFVFYDRSEKKPVVDEIDDILTNNNEGYYIKCSGKADSADCFLAVKKQTGTQQDPYITTCSSYDKSYDDDNMFMLFQIVSPAQTQFTETSSEQVKDLKAKLLKQYGVEFKL